MKVEYTVINSGENFLDGSDQNTPTEMKVLKTIHNAGFFSCATVRLMDIIIYFNINKGLPDAVDSKEQFIHYKSHATQDLIPFFYQEYGFPIPYNGDVPF